MYRILIIILYSLVVPALSAGQGPLESSSSRESDQTFELRWPGEGMAEALPNLVQISQMTNFFLSLEKALDLSPKQREALTRLSFEHESKLIRKSSEFQLATAEMNALLAETETDLEAVEMLIKKRGNIRIDIDLLKLGSALAATRVLTHEQHTRVLVITREIALNRNLQ